MAAEQREALAARLFGREFLAPRPLLQALEQHWHATAGGSGCTVVLRGDAGIGKSRAHHALRQQLTDTRHAWFQINGSSVMSQTAFHPIIQAIYEILEIAPGLPYWQHRSPRSASPTRQRSSCSPPSSIWCSPPTPR